MDDSFARVLARIAKLAWVQFSDGKPTCGYRWHTQFEILKGIPHRIDATSANSKGLDGERAVLEQTLEPDRLYVTVRGYQKWNLFNSIVAKRSSYHPVRMVIVQGTPHTSRGRNIGRKYSSTGPSSDGLIRLVTDMLDVPADLIAQIYHLRWLIEPFFKKVQAPIRVCPRATHIRLPEEDRNTAIVRSDARGIMLRFNQIQLLRHSNLWR